MSELNLACSVPERIIMVMDESNNYSSKLFKVLDLTFAHGSKIIERLAKEKILVRKKEGRIIYLKLTEKGMSLKYHLNKISELL